MKGRLSRKHWSENCFVHSAHLAKAPASSIYRGPDDDMLLAENGNEFLALAVRNARAPGKVEVSKMVGDRTGDPALQLAWHTRRPLLKRPLDRLENTTMLV